MGAYDLMLRRMLAVTDQDGLEQLARQFIYGGIPVSIDAEKYGEIVRHFGQEAADMRIEMMRSSFAELVEEDPRQFDFGTPNNVVDLVNVFRRKYGSINHEWPNTGENRVYNPCPDEEKITTVAELRERNLWCDRHETAYGELKDLPGILVCEDCVKILITSLTRGQWTVLHYLWLTYQKSENIAWGKALEGGYAEETFAHFPTRICAEAVRDQILPHEVIHRLRRKSKFHIPA